MSQTRKLSKKLTVKKKEVQEDEIQPQEPNFDITVRPGFVRYIRNNSVVTNLVSSRLLEHRMYHLPTIEGRSAWTDQVIAENGSRMDGIISSPKHGVKTVEYSMKKGTHKLGLSFTPLNENYLLIFDQEARDLCLDIEIGLATLNYEEGYLQKPVVVDKKSIKKQILGVDKVEKALNFETSDQGIKELLKEKFHPAPTYDWRRPEPRTLSIITPSVSTIPELRRCLETRLKLVHDLAEDKKVVLSPLPISFSRTLYIPYMIYSHQPFKSFKEEKEVVTKFGEAEIRRQRETWFSFLQSTRTTPFPLELDKYYDYITRIRFYDVDPHWEYLMRSHTFPDASKKFRSPFIPMCLTLTEHILTTHSIRMPSPFDLYTDVERGMGNFFPYATTYPPSLDEILAISSLNAALDRKLIDEVKSGKNFDKYPVQFHPFAAMLELSSYTYDRDPQIFFFDRKAMKDQSSSEYVATMLFGEKTRMQLLNELINKGLATQTTVSQYWDNLMKEISPYIRKLGADQYWPIILNDLKDKNGTNTLKTLYGSNKDYGELIEAASDCLYSGKRWIS
jgi:hypothetical protein